MHYVMIRNCIYIILCVLSAGNLAAQNANIAYSDNNTRFTVITERVVRMEYSPLGEFTDNPSFIAVNRDYPSVEYNVCVEDGWVHITTSAVNLKYKQGSGMFTDKNIAISASYGGMDINWKPGMVQRANLKGTYRTLDGMDGNLQTMDWLQDSQKGERLKLEDGILARDGWTLIDDSQGFLFDNDPEWPWVTERTNMEGCDWYFMAYGTDYKAALKDYTVFAGKIPMIPKYAFGYWWSRNWAYSDKEYRELVDNFKAYSIPLDVLVVDMDWHYTEPGKGGWTGWTWNKRLFPDYVRFMEDMKKDGLKLTLNLHPADGISHYEKGYEGVAIDMGIDPESKVTVPWDHSDKKFALSFFENVLTPMELEGVDFWWLDWQQGMYDKRLKGLSNTWWINYVFYTQMERFTAQRPLLYHRWGGLGNHRYQIGFSGDAVITWRSLDYQPYFNSTASNVLYGYWSHDLGGYIGEMNPEMYVRWMQFGTYSAIMRTHSVKGAGMNKEPWKYSIEYAEPLRRSIRQRYDLVPYIYSMARKAHDEGLSLCRPMYYEYPECEEAYSFKNEYMFGDNMIILPITKPMTDGYSEVDVWLPEGEWYEWTTGTLLKGGKVVRRYFSLDEFPVYVKAGCVIPTLPDYVMNLNDNNDDKYVLTLFPTSNDKLCSFLLYEDNGNSKDYETSFATTEIISNRYGSTHEIVIRPRKGHYEGIPQTKEYDLKVYTTCCPKAVTIDGKPAHFNYDGREFALTVSLDEKPCHKQTVVCMKYAEATVADANGIYGKARRVCGTIEKLKLRDAGLCLTDELGTMGSVCELATYYPDKLEDICGNFMENYRQLPAVLTRQGLDDDSKEWFLKVVGWNK